MKRKMIWIVLGSFCSLLLAVSAFNVIRIFNEYRQAESVYAEIQENYVSELPKPTETTASDSTEPHKDPAEAVPISVDFPALLAANEDIVGWIYCPDTPINYPVVQGGDNNKYLRRDLDGKYLVSGTVFADYRCNAAGKDFNFILYGHNMKDGTMFSSITQYKEQSYYDSHPIMYYLTPETDYRVELLAGYVTPRDSEIYTHNFGGENSSEDFIKAAIKNSTFQTNAEYLPGDKLLTLSTCSYEYNNARYVVIGKMQIVE